MDCPVHKVPFMGSRDLRVALDPTFSAACLFTSGEGDHSGHR